MSMLRTVTRAFDESLRERTTRTRRRKGQLRCREAVAGQRLVVAGPSHREAQTRRRKPAIRRYAEARFSSAPGRAGCGRDFQFADVPGS
jgi:hypothetical protein